MVCKSHYICRLAWNARNLCFLDQIESGRGSCEEGRREGKTRVHKKWIYEEEAAETDGWHGQCR